MSVLTDFKSEGDRLITNLDESFKRTFKALTEDEKYAQEQCDSANSRDTLGSDEI